MQIYKLKKREKNMIADKNIGNILEKRMQIGSSLMV